MKVAIISTPQMTETAENFCLPQTLQYYFNRLYLFVNSGSPEECRRSTLLLRKKHWGGTQSIFSLKITVPSSLGFQHTQCFSYCS